jgi:hypothetical protein
MKLSFFGIDILFKKQKIENFLSMNDINKANDEILLYIKKLGKDEIRNRARDVTFTIDKDVNTIKETLLNKGIVIIPDFVPQSSMNKIQDYLKIIREKISSFESSNKSIKEESDVLFQKGHTKIKTYDALANYKKSIVTIRQGQDQGMIDIFNINKWQKFLGDILEPYFNHSIIFEILNDNNGLLKPKNLNLYLNKEIKNTRGFHVDSYNKKFKGFIYLEDCLNLEYGPYTYVKESHVNSFSSKINKQISSILPIQTETLFVSQHNILPVLGKKGTLIISDQGGSHRGFPQSAEYERSVAVMNYK